MLPVETIDLSASFSVGVVDGKLPRVLRIDAAVLQPDRTGRRPSTTRSLC